MRKWLASFKTLLLATARYFMQRKTFAWDLSVQIFPIVSLIVFRPSENKQKKSLNNFYKATIVIS